MLKSQRKSKYSFETKAKAQELRRKYGYSFGMVAKELDVPYETMKNWLEGIKPEVEKKKLLRRPYPTPTTPYEELKGKRGRKKFLLRERGQRCEECGLYDWLGKPIPLEIHHKDGIQENWSKENLMLVCPNCHSFTDTYRGKNKASKRSGRVAQTEEAQS